MSTSAFLTIEFLIAEGVKEKVNKMTMNESQNNGNHNR